MKDVYIEKEREISVIADVDVLVCGGGPAGVGAAEIGFAVLNIFSYVGPLALFGVAIFQRRYGHYRMAGVRENTVFLGGLLAVCAWSAAFILAEMLAATALDACFLLTNASLRNRIAQRSFLLSLVAHGAPRLLFCLSVAASIGILYFTFDVLRTLARRTRGGTAVKIAAVFFGAVVCLAYLVGASLLMACFPFGTPDFCSRPIRCCRSVISKISSKTCTCWRRLCCTGCFTAARRYISSRARAS